MNINKEITSEKEHKTIYDNIKISRRGIDITVFSLSLFLLVLLIAALINSIG